MTGSKTQAVTIDGITVHVDTSVADDYDFYEQVTNLGGGNFAMPYILRRMLGTDYDVVKDHLADEDGHISVNDQLAPFIGKLFTAVSALKNS